jgi:hypothetical protein
LNKICRKCGIEKSSDNFGPRKKSKDGKYCRCKKCAAEDSALWRKNNPLEAFKTVRRWRESHREKLNGTIYIWRKNNPEKHSAIMKRSYEKRKVTQRGQLNIRMSCSIRQALKGRKSHTGWEKLVGYNVDQLKNHIESLFTKGMTWELFMDGEIHIDHKIPKAAFRYDSPDDLEFKKCWCLENLQPLWKKDNQKKHTKILAYG